METSPKQDDLAESVSYSRCNIVNWDTADRDTESHSSAAAALL